MAEGGTFGSLVSAELIYDQNFYGFFLGLRETLLITLAFGDVDACHSVGGRLFHPSLQFNSLWITSLPFGFAIEKDVTGCEP